MPKKKKKTTKPTKTNKQKNPLEGTNLKTNENLMILD